MRTVARWMAWLGLGAALLVACASDPAVPSGDDPFGANWSDHAVFADGLVGAVPDIAGDTVYHMDIVVSSDFERLNGREWIRYTNREDAELDALYLQLFGNATGSPTTVTGVLIGDATVEPVAELNGTVHRLPLQQALQPGEQVTLQVDFTVELSQDAAESYGVLGFFDGFLMLDGFYPVVLVYDDEGWNAQDLVPIGDLTHLDASWYLVRVTAPRDLQIVASGREFGRTVSGGDQVVSYAAGPARDFYLSAAADWEVVTGRVGDTAVNSYGRPDDREGAARALQVALQALALFDEQLGPYPYTEFDLAGAPMRALGIEYPGMTVISLAMYDLEGEVAGVPAPIMLEGTIAHEVAHQWFYNVVGNDQLDDPWLDEALAQYLTGLYYRAVYGDQAEQEYRESWASRWDRVDRREIPIGRATREYSPDQYSPIVYGRGPMFLASLEDLMGRATFAGFLRDYYRSNVWGIVTPEGFRSLAEQHCACDLSEMFEAWVDG